MKNFLQKIKDKISSNNQCLNIPDDCKIAIEVKEFQQKVLDYIESGEMDKMISETDTCYKDSPLFKMGVIQGMAISATTLISSCRQFGMVKADK